MMISEQFVCTQEVMLSMSHTSNGLMLTTVNELVTTR